MPNGGVVWATMKRLKRPIGVRHICPYFCKQYVCLISKTSNASKRRTFATAPACAPREAQFYEFGNDQNPQRTGSALDQILACSVLAS
jgi:hypothetical protein